MLRVKKMNKWIILIGAAVIVLLAVAACRMMLGNYVSIRGQHLNAYSFSSGGGMNGGYYRKTVKRSDDHALITIESAEWYADDPVVTEYLADAAILDELESVIRKHKMNFWHGKKFTNEFICDGETDSYRFNFDDAEVSFSSQIYPMPYGKKLAELNSIIKKYIDSSEKITD